MEMTKGVSLLRTTQSLLTGWTIAIVYCKLKGADSVALVHVSVAFH